MKIGLDQLEIPAPLLYRRIVNALIIIVIPAFGAMIAATPDNLISSDAKVLIGLASSFLVACLKGFEYILGPNETPPNPQQDEKAK